MAPLVPLPMVVVPTVIAVAEPPEMVLQLKPVPAAQFRALAPPTQFVTGMAVGSEPLSDPMSWLAVSATPPKAPALLYCTELAAPPGLPLPPGGVCHVMSPRRNVVVDPALEAVELSCPLLL